MEAKIEEAMVLVVAIREYFEAHRAILDVFEDFEIKNDVAIIFGSTPEEYMDILIEIRDL